uniref:Single-pass membrane and coiled-coil domain-containing protein 4 n=1 Tax=Sinocyclocheilus grahami TaxID=75366 RepID=A0A672KH97_SINGR
ARELRSFCKKGTTSIILSEYCAMQEAREQVTTVVLPTVAVLVLLIVLFVYMATRPGAIE